MVMILVLMRALLSMLLMMINSQFTLFRPLNRVLRAFLDARLEFLLLQRDCHQSVVCALIEESFFCLFMFYFLVSLHEHLNLVWCFCSMMKKGKLNLPFFPFVFSPFALFTEGERIVETRQKAIETVEQLIARVHLNQAVNRGPIPQTRTLTSWHLKPFAT